MKSDIEETPPAGAGSYVKKRLENEGHSPSSIARTIGVSPSTISRFFAGAELSVQLAAKLHSHYGLSIEGLFSLDVRKKTYQANQLTKTE